MEPFIGQIQLLPYSFAPKGWAPCDGSLLSIASNTALFSLLGTNFGGDGKTTFALPKLAGPSASVGYYIALNGIYPSRS
jgi:microcystin-dependent protein